MPSCPRRLWTQQAEQDALAAGQASFLPETQPIPQLRAVFKLRSCQRTAQPPPKHASSCQLSPLSRLSGAALD